MRQLALVLLVVVSAIMSGCGTPDYILKADKDVKAGDCDAALADITGSGMWIGDRYYMIAGVYEECYHDREKAIEAATLSARYGVEPAQNWLARVGAQIPSPDLKSGGAVFCSSSNGSTVCGSP